MSAPRGKCLISAPAKPSMIRETDFDRFDRFCVFDRFDPPSCQEKGSGRLMAVCQWLLRNDYVSILWGPHQWAAWA